jgi:hypothetical protein
MKLNSYIIGLKKFCKRPIRKETILIFTGGECHEDPGE